MWYHVAEPNTFLVLTGAGIRDMLIKKKGWVLPGQKVAKMSVTPLDFTMVLHAMTEEKLKFSLPAVFTIGPQVNDPECMRRYAVLFTGESDDAPAAASRKNSHVISSSRNHVQELVRAIIEHVTRSITSNMTIEEILASRTEYKKHIIEKVQSELIQFGLMVYNANVKELEDTPGSEYFQCMRLKAHEGAQNKTRVDVAKAQAEGSISQQREQARAVKETAQIDADTSVILTDLKKKKADAEARVKNNEISIEKDLNLARIAASRAAEVRDAELQRDVEAKRADMELQRLRATNVVQAKIERESRQERAEADLFAQKTKADGTKYSQQADAEARFTQKQRETDANIYTQAQNAEAQLKAARKQAEAIIVKRQAEAQGISALAKSYGELSTALGGPTGLMQYLMLQDNTYEKLALANAKAVQGLSPKINVWNTGAEGGAGAGDPGAAIRNIFQTLPPLMSTIQDQTGMTPPNWLVGMPQQQQQQQQALAQKNAKVNGT